MSIVTPSPGNRPTIAARDIGTWPLRHDVINESIRIEGGRAWLPDGPGFGVTLNDDALERYRIV